jgi:thioredoxin 1
MQNGNKIQELVSDEFNNFIKKGIVFIDFFTEWNMQSLMMSPIIEEISNKFKNIKFGKVDISESYNLKKRLNIDLVPTFLIFRDGEIINRFIGNIPEEELEENLKRIH